MRKLIHVVLFALLLASPALADDVVYVPRSKVEAAKATGGPLSAGSDYIVAVSRRDKGGQSEIHEDETDTFYIMEGSATFVTGGTVTGGKTTAPGQIRGSGISGGAEHKLSAGDVIVIPKGTPHWFKEVPELVVYYVVKSKPLMRMDWTRREWLAAIAAGAAACASETPPEPASEPSHERAIGLNLYTVRDPLAEEPERVLREVAAAGCRYVEGRLEQIESHLGLLVELDMPWVSWMIPTPLVTGRWDVWEQLMTRMGQPLEQTTLEATIETAASRGVQNLGLSYTLPPEREGPDGWLRIAEQCNQAGEACQKAGLQFYFHNHAEEFTGEPGARPFDLLLEKLDPALVRFEIDCFWVSIAGADPAEAIRQASGRVLSLHLKDKAAGTANVETAFAAPRDAFREIGAGTLDWPSILAAADEAGVERLFVEQDQTPGDPLDSVRQSFGYLKGLG